MQKKKISKVVASQTWRNRGESLPKIVLPHVKKLVVGSKRNPSPLEQTVQRRAPPPIPKPLPQQKQRGERRKHFHPHYRSIYRDAFQFPKGTCWHNFIFSSMGAEENFDMTVLKRQNPINC
jgi:hypothetical protein